MGLPIAMIPEQSEADEQSYMKSNRRDPDDRNQADDFRPMKYYPPADDKN